MKIGKDVVLVTGATGQQGGAVAHELLAKKHRVAVMTRKPDSPAAQALASRLGMWRFACLGSGRADSTS